MGPTAFRFHIALLGWLLRSVQQGIAVDEALLGRGSLLKIQRGEEMKHTPHTSPSSSLPLELEDLHPRCFRQPRGVEN